MCRFLVQNLFRCAKTGVDNEIKNLLTRCLAAGLEKKVTSAVRKAVPLSIMGPNCRPPLKPLDDTLKP